MFVDCEGLGEGVGEDCCVGDGEGDETDPVTILPNDVLRAKEIKSVTL